MALAWEAPIVTILDKLREAIRNQDTKSRRAIARAAGLDHACVYRFAAGQAGLSARSIDAVAAALDLDVQFVPRSNAGER